MQKSIKWIFMICLSMCFSNAQANDTWASHLYAPTYLKKLDGKWILVDCWHSRILWSKDLNPNLKKWNVLENKYSAHSMDFDGSKYFMTEDTEHGAIVVYKFENNKFVQTGYLNGLGKRTHRTVYDPKSDSFLVISATSGDIWRIKVAKGTPETVNHARLPFPGSGTPGDEIRTFTIHKNRIYFVSSPKNQHVYATTNDDKYTILEEYPVPSVFENMQEIYFLSDDRVLITAWPLAFSLIKNVSDLGKAKNIYSSLPFKGSPYWITQYKGNLIIPEIGDYNGVGLWSYADGDLHKIRDLFPMISANDSDKLVKGNIHFQ